MKRCEAAAMSKLHNLTLWKERGEQDNNAWQTFPESSIPDDLSKSEQHDITQPKLSVYPWRFYGDDKTLKRRFQEFFILNIRGLNIQLKTMRLLVSAVSFLSWGKGSSPFSLLS